MRRPLSFLVNFEIGESGNAANDSGMERGSHGHAAPSCRGGRVYRRGYQAVAELCSCYQDQS